MEYETKARLFRLVQGSGIALMVLALAYLFLYVRTSGPNDQAMSPFFLLFGVMFTLIVVSMLLFYGYFTGAERRRFMIERSGGGRGEPPTFVMMPDEATALAPEFCVYHISSMLSYRENSGYVSVTSKRIDIKRPGAELNFWRKEVKEIPKRGLTFGSYIYNYTIQTVSYEEETEEGKTTGHLKLGLGETSVMTEVKIYHPRSREIAEMFSKPG